MRASPTPGAPQSPKQIGWTASRPDRPAPGSLGSHDQADIPAQEAASRQGARLPRTDEYEGWPPRAGRSSSEGPQEADRLTRGEGMPKDVGSLDMIRSAVDFRAMQANSRSRTHPLLLLRYRRNELDRTRYGISTGRRIGTAVVRNTVRRRLRTVLRRLDADIERGWDVLLIARAPAATASQSELDLALRRLVLTAGLTRPIDAPGATIVKRVGIAPDPRLPAVLLLAAVVLPLRAELLALHRAGNREVRPVQGQLDGRQAHRALPSVASRRVRPCPLSERPARAAAPPSRLDRSPCWSSLASLALLHRCLRTGADRLAVDHARSRHRPRPPRRRRALLPRRRQRRRRLRQARRGRCLRTDRQPVPAADAAADDPARRSRMPASRCLTRCARRCRAATRSTCWRGSSTRSSRRCSWR